MRVGYLGPLGTVSHEALMSAPGAEGFELVPLPTLHAAVLAVHDGDVDRALVPIENSLEGTVTATVDALSAEERLRMVGEEVLAVSQCLIARSGVALADVTEVRSHPQALAQSARFLREQLPAARVVPTSSTAEAVRSLDGAGDGRPGWLVRCLSELAFRGVNMVKIESRPARRQLGHYLFLADCEGRADDETVAAAVAGLGNHCDRVRVLGTYPAAPRAPVS
jgi:prephenate dehydratase